MKRIAYKIKRVAMRINIGTIGRTEVIVIQTIDAWRGGGGSKRWSYNIN